MSVRDILLDVAPDLTPAQGDTAASDRLDRFIGYAEDEVNRTLFGARADKAVALLAAHALTVAGRGGDNRGALVSERVGDMSATYAQPPVSADRPVDPLDSTSYGVEYKRLRRGIVGARVIT
jgi:hypothetical protein